MVCVEPTVGPTAAVESEEERSQSGVNGKPHGHRRSAAASGPLSCHAHRHGLGQLASMTASVLARVETEQKSDRALAGE